MSLVWKSLALVAVLLVIQFHVAESLHHQHEKKGKYVGADGMNELPSRHHRLPHRRENESGENHSCIVHGKIHCHGEPVEGARPYLFSAQYPTFIINICATNEDGWYRLSTGAFFEIKEKVIFTIRHQCKMDGLEPMPKCAVPYYTTEIPLDVSNTTYVGRSFELSKLRDFSTSDCLY